jgi:hypothetical protein
MKPSHLALAVPRPSDLNRGLAWSLEHERITRPLLANRSPNLASRAPTGTRTAPAEARSHLLERYMSWGSLWLDQPPLRSAPVYPLSSQGAF